MEIPIIHAVKVLIIVVNVPATIIVQNVRKVFSK